VNPIEDWLTQPGGLADQLRAMRELAGLSGRALAAAAGWQPSKVSRIENGRQLPTGADLGIWARVCSASPDAEQALLRTLDEVQATHRDWKRRMRRGQAAVQASYNRLVEQARLVRHFETAYVPGLLQTPEYARRVFDEQVQLHGLDVEDVEAAIAVRLERQRLLYAPGKRFEFLLAEPVLRWLLCPPATMRAQLDRLQSVIGLPNVRLGVLPLGVQIVTTPQNSFQLYDELAMVETFIGETAHRDDAAAAYGRALDLLWQDAVTGEEARRLIVRAAEALPLDQPPPGAPP